MGTLYKILAPHTINRDETYQPIIELKKELNALQLKHFFEHDIYTLNWWVNLSFTIIPLLIWLKFVDRKRLLEITVYGLLILALATFLDVAGASLMIWEYPDKLLPFLPVWPIDFVVVPVTLMFVYQHCHTWKSFTIAVLFVSLLFSFVAEPLLVKYGFYTLVSWNYLYSFPIYLFMALLMRLLVRWLLAHQT